MKKACRCHIQFDKLMIHLNKDLNIYIKCNIIYNLIYIYIIYGTLRVQLICILFIDRDFFSTIMQDLVVKEKFMLKCRQEIQLAITTMT